MTFNLKKYYVKRQAFVEKALDRAVAMRWPVRLHKAMRYSLLGGGKRLRPILVLAAAEACGSPARRALPTALAFECLHTYSLIHDDLPAMDDDAMRRGRPTSHKAFDEATAILAGDALLTLAFELVARNAGQVGVKASAAVEAARVLAVAAGSIGMVGGQMADMLAEGKRINVAGLKAIHAGKTGALIQAALECGALLAGASVAKRRALARFGKHIGLAFQVADDVLNVEGDAKKMGKATGSDRQRGKATYPALMGLAPAKLLMRSELKKAQNCLSIFGAKGEPLGALARFVIERDR